MNKIMPLDLLSSIKGAQSSEAVSELFNVIKKAIPDGESDSGYEINVESLSLEDLRGDEVVICPEFQRELIRKNFPEEKDGFLVVPKVIEE